MILRRTYRQVFFKYAFLLLSFGALYFQSRGLLGIWDENAHTWTNVPDPSSWLNENRNRGPYSIHSVATIEGRNSLTARHSSNEKYNAIESLLPTDQGFGACLIMKDDNHWLIEWIAYHYHVLPLKHLIVLRDPRSLTPSQHIFDRWNQTYLEIEEWQDSRVTPISVYERGTKKKKTDLQYHLTRQRFFYSKCLKHLKQEQTVQWVLLTDTDEFVRVNSLLYPLSASVLQQRGHVSAFLAQRKVQDPCLQMPRIQVSSIRASESSINDQGKIDAWKRAESIEGLNASDFLTYQWLVHNNQAMSAGKSTMYLPTLKTNDIPSLADSVHRIVSSVCPEHSESLLNSTRSYLSVMHYLGTYEQFSYRTDPRDYDAKDAERAQKQFENIKSASVKSRVDTWYHRGRKPAASTLDVGMTHWLPGLVETVGLYEVKKLLENVGVLESIPVETSQHSKSKQQPEIDVEEEVFSACLLTKDDNHWLIEWLAYHYYVFKLRRLTVVRDPTSRTSIEAILDRWKDRMSISVWNDEQFVPSWILQKHKTRGISDTLLHRYRQQFFYSSCMKDFKQRDRSWLALVDTDEILRPNPYVLTAPIDLKVEGIGLTLLEEQQKKRAMRAEDGPLKCIHVPRLQIVSTEANASTVSSDIPLGLNGSDFLTTRWLYHNNREISMGNNLDGKSVFNLQWLDESAIPKRAANAHYIIPGVCPETSGDRLDHPDSWLLIHHYLGSLEQFVSRDDPRNSIEGRPKRDASLWRQTGQSPAADTFDDSLRSWLTGFVESVGYVDAKRLLAGVGQVEELSPMTA